MTITARLAALEKPHRAEALRLTRAFEDEIARQAPGLDDEGMMAAIHAILNEGDPALAGRLFAAYRMLGLLPV